MPTEVVEKILPKMYEVLPDGRWSFHLDAHMLGVFSACERKFDFLHLQNLAPRGAVRFSWAVGSWWSEVMSRFYEEMLLGKLTKESSIISAVQCWTNLGMDQYKVTSPKAYTDFGGSFKEFELPDGNHYTIPTGAITMIGRYYDHQADVDRRIWKIIGTESAFGAGGEVVVGETAKVIVNLLGKPDLFVLENDRWLEPVDHKTVDRIDADFTLKWKPHPQTIGYIYAGQILAKKLGYDYTVDRCVINGAARKEPSDNPRNGKQKPRFLRAYPSYSTSEIEEWRLDVLRKTERIRACIETGITIMNPSSCHLFDGCEYRQICAVKPESRAVVIASGYSKVRPWNPYNE